MSKLIKTERLVLRQPMAADPIEIAKQLNNFAVSGNLGVVPFPYSVADAEEWLGRWPKDAGPIDTHFLITLDDDVAIGTVGFREQDGAGLLGYWLGEAFWGRGIMTEAAFAVVDWYFEATNADRIISGVFHFNMASLAIQQKLGFVETGRSTMHALARNEDVEHIDTELTKDAFETVKERTRHEKETAK